MLPHKVPGMVCKVLVQVTLMHFQVSQESLFFAYCDLCNTGRCSKNLVHCQGNAVR